MASRLEQILNHFRNDSNEIHIQQNKTSQWTPSPSPKDALFLGLDSSTQGLKAIIIDASTKVVYEDGINFDKDLPHYKTSGGVYHGDGLEVTAPSLMFVEAIDLLLQRISKSGKVDLSKVAAVSGSGQQHGSVYWGLGSKFKLNTLSADSDLRSQLKDAFAIPNGPIWMDSSTNAYCKHMEKLCGGPQQVADISGSRAYERFTGQQISKIIDKMPESYKKCERISLVSSFISTVLSGDYQSIDGSDACGMNMMDILNMDWSENLLTAVVSPPGSFLSEAEGKKAVDLLRYKLGSPAWSHEVGGPIHTYFQEKYGFSGNCIVLASTGDNPSTVAGLKLASPGDVAISLGTSDTVLAIVATNNIAPSGEEGHLLRNPADPNSCFAMLCIKNGSITREKTRDNSGFTSWDEFNRALEMTPVGNNGNIGFYFLEAEITPRYNATGVFRFNSSGKKVKKFDSPAIEARAIIEGQILNMRSHAKGVGLDKPKRVIATGGASVNKAILQTMSNIFGAPVYTADTANTASLGAAYRALHGYNSSIAGRYVPFNSIFPPESSDLVLVAKPQPEAASIYESILSRYMSLEKQVLQS